MNYYLPVIVLSDPCFLSHMCEEHTWTLNRMGLCDIHNGAILALALFT